MTALNVSDQLLRRVGYTLCASSIVAALIALPLTAWAGVLGEVFDNYVLPNAVTALLYGALGILLIRFELRNLLTWVIVASAVCQGFPALIQSISELEASRQGVEMSQLDVSGWPPGLALFVGLANGVWVFPFYGVPTVGLLLAPTGRLLSRRWLPLAVWSVAGSAWMWVLFSSPWPIQGGDAADTHEGTVLAAGAGVLGASLWLLLVLCFGSLVVRYRRSDATDRRRLRWVLVGGAIYVVALVAGFPPALLIPILMISLTLAIWRDQLFDIDVVLSRTLLFGFLALFIGTVYVGIVYGIGALIGQTGGGNQGLSLLATVIVAFAFQPVRRRLERAANRLVYGRRASPYEVLSDLSSRLGRAEVTSGLLDRMVERLAAGTGADQAVLWRARNGSEAAVGFEAAAAWPTDTNLEPIEQLPATAVAIERSGQELGALTVTKPRGDELNPTERRLMADLAGSAGLVLDRARLDAALTEQAAALYRSRRRLVGAQDEERQRLEQQLHGGTQRQLDRLAVRLDANATLAADSGLEPAAAQLTALAAEARTARQEIEALARGVYPPVLEADGLTAAVESLVASLPIAVDVSSTTSRRFELDTELAVYFCVAEALTNVAKHARASTVSVRLGCVEELLAFEVADDGIGMLSASSNGGSTGLTGLVDRIEAVGGELKVSSTPGEGTTVYGSVAVSTPANAG